MSKIEESVTNTEKTIEAHHQFLIEMKREHGLTPLGLMTNHAWRDDPKRLTFTFARYKFVAKMLSRRKNVLEIGCADAFCTRVVQQEVERVTVTDIDPVFIADVKSRMDPKWPFAGVFVHDMLAGPLTGQYDGAYALDVLEHIEPNREDEFLHNLVLSLTAHGVAIFGMPSLESQRHASHASKAGHVNCKTGEALRTTLQRHFHTVFIFSMNDEVVHTGFFPMAQYLFAVACEPKPV